MLLSLPAAMRALAALAMLAAWSLAHSHHEPVRKPVPRFLLSAFGIDNQSPVHRILNCIQNLGPTKCLSALSVWRAERAIETFSQDRENQFNLTADVIQFPWDHYTNSSQEQLYSQLCDGTEGLLQYRKMSLNVIPGYTLQLNSKEDGKLNVDILKSNEIESARGSMKKLKRKFLNIVPILLIPGLIMAAILPFVLPAMKMATMGAVIINNMALTGAIFSILRDNAFNDYSRPKVKYINAGYKNEEEIYREHDVHFSKDHHDREHSGSNVHQFYDQFLGDNIEVVGENTPNIKWVKEHELPYEYYTKKGK